MEVHLLLSGWFFVNLILLYKNIMEWSKTLQTAEGS